MKTRRNSSGGRASHYCVCALEKADFPDGREGKPHRFCGMGGVSLVTAFTVYPANMNNLTTCAPLETRQCSNMVNVIKHYEVVGFRF